MWSNDTFVPFKTNVKGDPDGYSDRGWKSYSYAGSEHMEAGSPEWHSQRGDYHRNAVSWSTENGHPELAAHHGTLAAVADRNRERRALTDTLSQKDGNS